MGATDVMDHTFSCNRPGIRSKRWWFPLLTFCRQFSLYNSYYNFGKHLELAHLISTSSILLCKITLFRMAILPKSQEAKCFMVTRVWKTEYPIQPEMIKFPTLLKMLKKEQDVLFVINQMMSVNASNAMSICT